MMKISMYELEKPAHIQKVPVIETNSSLSTFVSFSIFVTFLAGNRFYLLTTPNPLLQLFPD